MRRTLVIALVISLTASATAVGSGRVESSVSFLLAPDGQAVRGHVRSTEHACERRRRVVIKKQRKGNDVPVAQARTNPDGRFRTRIPLDYATYYAQIRGENRGTTEVPCKGDRSSSMTFGPPPPP